MTIPDSAPVSRQRIWIGVFGSVVLLVLSVIYTIFVHPFMMARSAALRFQALGAELGFPLTDESSRVPQIIKDVGGDKLPILVRYVSFSDDSKKLLTDSDLPLLRAFPDLTGVYLTNQQITTEGLRQLAGLNLEWLGLAGTRLGSGRGSSITTGNDLEPLKRLTDLDYLDLSRTCVVDADLAALSDLRKLRNLNLSDTRITSAGIAHLSKLSDLRDVDLSGTQVDDDIGARLGHLKSGLTLDLSRTKVTGRGLQNLKVGGIRLKLQETALDDEGLRCISLMPTTTVLGIDISRTKVSPRGLDHLKALPLLHHLEMNGPHFNDDHLAAVASFPGLSDLILLETQVTAEGIRKLEQMKELRVLNFDADLLKGPHVIESLRRIPNLEYLSIQASATSTLDDAELQRQLGPKIRLFVDRRETSIRGL